MTTLSITDKFIKTYTYETYKNLVLKLAENSGSTGEQTAEHIEATKINAQRIKRIDKQCRVNPALIEAVTNYKTRTSWLLIAESWCGDGAQCIPVIAKIAALAPNIELKIILRDAHPEVIGRYLTNGSRSIPKLICIHKDSEEEIGLWGPRPDKIQQMVINFKLNNPTASHGEFVNNLHLWYAKDQTQAIQEDFLNLFNQWKSIH